MQAYRFCVYLALLSAITSGIATAMVYTDTNWFPGVNIAHTASVMQTGSSNADMINQTNSLSPTMDMSDTTTVQKTLTAGTVVWNMFKGIFYIKGIIDDTINIPSPSDASVNLFGYFSSVIQVGIYLIYIIGLLQYYNKVMLKYAY